MYLNEILRIKFICKFNLSPIYLLPKKAFLNAKSYKLKRTSVSGKSFSPVGLGSFSALTQVFAVGKNEPLTS